MNNSLFKFINELNYNEKGNKKMLTVEEIAKVAHEVNKAFCESNNDHSQNEWKNCEQWQKDSAINGVKYHLENTNTSPEDSHKTWLKEKINSGWKYGKVKDTKLKTHPSMLPYEKLPLIEKTKDFLFSQVVDSLKEYS